MLCAICACSSGDPKVAAVTVMGGMAVCQPHLVKVSQALWEGDRIRDIVNRVVYDLM